jgi:hypothetical protein
MLSRGDILAYHVIKTGSMIDAKWIQISPLDGSQVPLFLLLYLDSFVFEAIAYLLGEFWTHQNCLASLRACVKLALDNYI